tara:strand:+ start:639 stop:881 length:243 start_codon:yes stop_codon:yes gene_type:complete
MEYEFRTLVKIATVMSDFYKNADGEYVKTEYQIRMPENHKPDVYFYLTKDHIVEHTQIGNTTVTKIMPRDLCSAKGEILT